MLNSFPFFYLYFWTDVVKMFMTFILICSSLVKKIVWKIYHLLNMWEIRFIRNNVMERFFFVWIIFGRNISFCVKLKSPRFMVVCVIILLCCTPKKKESKENLAGRAINMCWVVDLLNCPFVAVHRQYIIQEKFFLFCGFGRES